MHLTEAEALLQLSNQESDEGIVSDQSSSADPEDASKRVKVRYKIWNMLHAYKSFRHTKFWCKSLYTKIKIDILQNVFVQSYA